MKRKIIITIGVIVLILIAFPIGIVYLNFLAGIRVPAITGIFQTSEKMTYQEAPQTEYPGKDMAPLPMEAEKALLESDEGLNNRVDNSASGSIENRLVIRNRFLQLEVKEVETASSKVEEIVEKYGGYIQSLTYSTEELYPTYPYEESYSAQKRQLEGIKRANIVAKIPNENFTKFSNEVKKLGKLESDTETSEEVTERFIDLQARLKNAKNEEEVLTGFLQKAEKVEEMLQVEKELSRIREKVETLEAQIKYLERSTSMAIATVNLHEPKPLIEPINKDWGFIEAIRQAIKNFVIVIELMIITTGAILPFIIIISVILYIVKRGKNKNTKIGS